MISAKPMRGVIIFDIDVFGGVNSAADFDKALKEYADDLSGYLKEVYPKVFNEIRITQTLSGVPLQERRGATGPINEIVFRGTRGPYKTKKK